MGTSIQDMQDSADDLMQQAINTLQQPVGEIPNMSHIDLSTARDALNKAINTGGEMSDTIDTEKERLSKANEEKKKGIDDTADAGVEKGYADAARAAEEAQVYKNAARMFGVDLDPSSDIAAGANALHNMEPVLQSKLQRVQEAESANMLDDPLGWASAQLKLPSLRGDYNATATAYNSLEASINDGITTANNAAALSAKGIPTVTDSMAKANADAALAKARTDKADADRQLATTNVDFATKKLGFDLSVAQDTRQLSSVEIQQNEMMLTATIQRVKLAEDRATRQQAAAKLLEQLTDNRQVDVMLRNYESVMGKPAGSVTRTMFARFPKNEQENITAIAAGNGGSNPFDFYINFSNAKPGPELSPETGRLFDDVQSKMDAIPDNKKMMIKGMPKEVQPAAFAEELRNMYASDAKNPGSSGNIFHSLPPNLMITTNAPMAGTQMAKILEPLTKTGQPVPDDVVVKTISASYPNPVDAGQAVASYYQQNVATRNRSLNMSFAGIKNPTDYIVPVKRPLGWGFGTAGRFDLTQPAEATKMIVLERMYDAALPKGFKPFGADQVQQSSIPGRNP